MMAALLQRQPLPTSTATHCPYCALQCGMVLLADDGGLRVTARPDFPVNKGGMCIKGWTAAETLQHPERLQTPLARTAEGALAPISWEEALERVASGLRTTQERFGPAAVGVFGGGSLTNETAYLLGKFARVALRTPNIDYNGRFCMSSAAAAANLAFGLDRGLPFPLEDLAQAEAVLLVGSNLAETMPPAMQYLEAQRRNGGTLAVIDPRQSPTAQAAGVHLQLTPGSDLALANGLLHLCIREGLVDATAIRARTAGFAAVRSAVAAYWPERVERLTGVPEAQLLRVARMLGSARTAMILTARGSEQQSHGVANVLGWINLALALGLPGRAGSGYGCLTGQGNGQGGREHGQKADQLPGYRSIDNPVHRREIAAVWGIDEATLPGPGLSAYELLDRLGQEGGLRALLVMGSNPAVSAPHARHVQRRLQQLDFLVVADFFLSETAELADVVLPAAQWAEDEGTMTNLEGRVLLRRRAVLPPAGVLTDWQILCALAERLGRGASFRFTEPRAIFAELRRASAGGLADYNGISYEKIVQQDGVFWPCSSDEHPGTPRLFANGFATADGRARFQAVRFAPPAEEPDAEYPLYLTTGRLTAHYQSGAQTRRITALRDAAPEPFAEVHPTLARRHDLAEGEPLMLRTRRGAATFKARLTTTIRPDTIFVPFHWGGRQAANNLTNPALDPVSRMPEFKVCAVRIERLTPAEAEVFPREHLAGNALSTKSC